MCMGGLTAVSRCCGLNGCKLDIGVFPSDKNKRVAGSQHGRYGVLEIHEDSNQLVRPLQMVCTLYLSRGGSSYSPRSSAERIPAESNNLFDGILSEAWASPNMNMGTSTVLDQARPAKRRRETPVTSVF